MTEDQLQMELMKLTDKIKRKENYDKKRLSQVVKLLKELGFPL